MISQQPSRASTHILPKHMNHLQSTAGRLVGQQTSDHFWPGRLLG
jgi:hypothetical protein